MERHKADCCKCHKHAQPAQQTITDMEFDRGIWSAVIHNEIERVREFIAKGKAMDRDNCDYTALHYAARTGNEAICEELLENGNADVNAITKGGATPLHRAAMMGHLNIIKLFVKHKASLHNQDEDGQTALHRCVVRGHMDVAKYLMELDPHLKEVEDNRNKTAFEYLTANANDDFKVLLKPSQISP